MHVLRRSWRLAAFAAAAGLWSACSDQTPTQPSVAAPAAARTSGSAAAMARRTPPNPDEVRAALAVLGRHAPALMRVPTVVGVAVGATPEGKARIEIFRSHDDPAVAIPAVLENVPVASRVTGLFVARSDPTMRLRPAPTGYSVGHPAITAGTIAARVVDASGNVYALSNNHVLANSNNATIGDPMLQPGPYDGGTLADQIGTLAAFYPIDFSTSGQNTMDAAIARSSTADLGNGTPTDDGYGTPNGTIYGDANADGVFDDLAALLTLPVQKYGRTTKLTHGTITGINASVSICYEVLLGIFCIKSATFVGQLIIEPGAFSGGGDSGSLIVTDDDAKHPVALLFAGSSTQTIANRIDLVLNHFGVRIDGTNTPPPPPTPVTDVAVTGISAPASILQGTTASITVSVRNAGNQDVGGFDVTLRDQTAGTVIGTRSVPSLAAGATTTLAFDWNTASSALGEHVLLASHSLTDDNASNDQASATTTLVTVQVSDMHVGDLDGWADRSGSNRWAATVEVTVHDGSHAPLNGATVVGAWSPSGSLASDTCTTGEGGGTGTCIFLFPSISKSRASVSFTVTSVTLNGRTYQTTQNHDPDGSSNGTTVVVRRP